MLPPRLATAPGAGRGLAMAGDSSAMHPDESILKALRAYRSCSVAVLESHGFCSPRYLRRYLAALEKAGIARVSGGLESGRVSLAYDPGPHPIFLKDLQRPKPKKNNQRPLAAEAGSQPPKAGAIMRRVVDYCASAAGPVIVLSDLLEATGLPRRKALPVLNRLCQKGHVQRVDVPPHAQARPTLKPMEPGPERAYRVVSDCWSGVAQHSNSTRDAMWSVIWERKQFSVRTLRRASGCSRNAANKYINLLILHGYVSREAFAGNRRLYAVTAKATAQRPNTPKKRKGEG